ncbi:hypothetical protein ACFW1A_01515 [Kitasatospora sp. NPDC058965]|uniref:hypothetical protein n=1 Tax=Kitasatospora sp. NPDC058965 TaxID=3346682 RepID=UPI0036CF34BC
MDERHLYLVRLIRDLELSPAPVISLLAGDHDDCEQATGVLEMLARSGSMEARQVLRSYIREGEHWVDVLESVAGCWPVEWSDDLADVARSRLTGDEPLLWRCEPVGALAASAAERLAERQTSARQCCGGTERQPAAGAAR